MALDDLAHSIFHDSINAQRESDWDSKSDIENTNSNIDANAIQVNNIENTNGSSEINLEDVTLAVSNESSSTNNLIGTDDSLTSVDISENIEISSDKNDMLIENNISSENSIVENKTIIENKTISIKVDDIDVTENKTELTNKKTSEEIKSIKPTKSPNSSRAVSRVRGFLKPHKCDMAKDYSASGCETPSSDCLDEFSDPFAIPELTSSQFLQLPQRPLKEYQSLGLPPYTSSCAKGDPRDGRNILTIANPIKNEEFQSSLTNAHVVYNEDDGLLWPLFIRDNNEKLTIGSRAGGLENPVDSVCPPPASLYEGRSLTLGDIHAWHSYYKSEKTTEVIKKIHAWLLNQICSIVNKKDSSIVELPNEKNLYEIYPKSKLITIDINSDHSEYIQSDSEHSDDSTDDTSHNSSIGDSLPERLSALLPLSSGFLDSNMDDTCSQHGKMIFPLENLNDEPIKLETIEEKTITPVTEVENINMSYIVPIEEVQDFYVKMNNILNEKFEISTNPESGPISSRYEYMNNADLNNTTHDGLKCIVLWMKALHQLPGWYYPEDQQYLKNLVDEEDWPSNNVVNTRSLLNRSPAMSALLQNSKTYQLENAPLELPPVLLKEINDILEINSSDIPLVEPGFPTEPISINRDVIDLSGFYSESDDEAWSSDIDEDNQPVQQKPSKITKDVKKPNKIYFRSRELCSNRDHLVANRSDDQLTVMPYHLGGQLLKLANKLYQGRTAKTHEKLSTLHYQDLTHQQGVANFYSLLATELSLYDSYYNDIFVNDIDNCDEDHRNTLVNVETTLVNETSQLLAVLYANSALIYMNLRNDHYAVCTSNLALSLSNGLFTKAWLRLVRSLLREHLAPLAAKALQVAHVIIEPHMFEELFTQEHPVWQRLWQLSNGAQWAPNGAASNFRFSANISRNFLCFYHLPKDKSIPEIFSTTGPLTLEFCDAVTMYQRSEKTLPTRVLFRILNEAFEVLSKEKNVIRYNVGKNEELNIAGDVHGQYYDLCNMWKLFGKPSFSKPYLFNGDFVDRGAFSVETIIALLTYKAVLKDKLILIRGNHETQCMNVAYGFFAEVVRKYDYVTYVIFRNIFQHLPLCAVVNNTIFIVHGGIMQDSKVLINDIDDINRICEPPQEGVMNDMLWSDPSPLPGKHLSKRGVSHNFGPDMTEDFLSRNNLKLIVRAHEVQNKGFTFCHSRKLITVFSAPNYCDQVQNMAGLLRLKNPTGKQLKLECRRFSAAPHPMTAPLVSINNSNQALMALMRARYMSAVQNISSLSSD